jgi:hypothetical protein
VKIDEREKKQKSNKKVPGADRSSGDNSISTVEKILTNLMTLRKITNGDRVSHEPLREK